jgi:MinD-like ATPase involved in chromosome partitioning or flagellar assembly
MRQKRGLALGVFSAKGGVGKTTCVVNLGAAIAQKLKNRVIIVETNMTASNLGLHLGILDPPVVIQDLIFGKIKVDDAILTTDYGLHLIPGSVAFTDEIGSIDLNNIIDDLRKKYDLILIDSAPGFGLEVFAGLKSCDELLICCQPRVPAIAGTLQTFRAADRLKIPVFGVVLSRVTGKRFEIPTSDIKRTLGWPLMAEIPEDDLVEEGVTRGVPVVIRSPNSPAAIEYRKLAQAVLTHLRARKRIATSRKRRVTKRGRRQPKSYGR